MLEEGQRPPTPSRAGTRTMQVNVRLTAEEKVLLESTAKRQGYSAPIRFSPRRGDRVGPLGPPKSLPQRMGRDSNPRRTCALSSFQDCRLRPLGHPS